MNPEHVNVFKKARLIGLFVSVFWPLCIILLMIQGSIRPGILPALGWVKQLSYTFTAIAIAIPAWVTFRSQKVLKKFAEQTLQKQYVLIYQESLLYVAVLQLNCITGVLYWLLAGAANPQPAFTFVMLTPISFLLFIPRLSAWAEAQGD